MFFMISISGNSEVDKQDFIDLKQIAPKVQTSSAPERPVALSVTCLEITTMIGGRWLHIASLFSNFNSQCFFLFEEEVCHKSAGVTCIGL